MSTKKTNNPSGALRTVFIPHFDALWRRLFTSPVHLDSALSKVPPSMKAPLAEITRVILQRPNSIAHYLGFRLSEGEPWGLSQEELAEWPTARAMAERLFNTWKKNPEFQEGAHSFDNDFPPAILHEWEADFGRVTSRNLARELAGDSPLSLRVSRRVDYLETLSAINDSLPEGRRARQSQISPQGIIIDGYASVLKSDAHREGSFEIQDEGSQIMAFFALWPELFRSLLHEAPGKTKPFAKGFRFPETKPSFVAVDACAGAGGKTLAIADAVRGRGQIFAYDLSEKKLLSLRKRATRAQVNNIKAVLVQEGAEVNKKFLGKADLVLVDAPCTGWGVLRRNPEIKWRQDQETRDRMPELQLSILQSYAPLVKPGGRLVYGVCTIRRAETTKVAERFLAANKDFSAHCGGFLGPYTTDGFYMIAFTRAAKPGEKA